MVRYHDDYARDGLQLVEPKILNTPKVKKLGQHTQRTPHQKNFASTDSAMTSVFAYPFDQPKISHQIPTTTLPPRALLLTSIPFTHTNLISPCSPLQSNSFRRSMKKRQVSLKPGLKTLLTKNMLDMARQTNQSLTLGRRLPRD